MKKGKSKKSNKQPLLNPLSITLAITTLCLAVVTGYLAFHFKTHEEEKRLQAFESIVAKHIFNGDMFEDKQNISVKATGIGVTDDDDLYVDFKFIKYDDNGPLYIKKGREHYQCKNRSGKVIENWELPDGCSVAYWYGEPKYFDQGIRNELQEMDDYLTSVNEKYYSKLKAIYGAGNYTEVDGGIEFHDVDLTEEQERELKAANEEFNEAYSNVDEYNNLHELLWEY